MCLLENNKMNIVIGNKNVNIFYKSSDVKELPVIIINCFDDDGNDIWNKCLEVGCKDFILVSINKINWNNDLTPWESGPIFKGDEGYLGNADNYLNILEKNIIPTIEDYVVNTLKKEISYYGLAGYSLAGLFAIYSGFKTDIFKKIASMSGSLWYHGFEEFVKLNNISKNIDKIYFSLGNKEAITKNEILSKVEIKTKNIYEYLKNSSLCIYEENEGNHFKEVSLRIAKGIKEII